MGARGTLVLAILVLAGSGYLWFEGPSKNDPHPDALLVEARDAAAVEPTKLIDFNPDEITQITLTRGGKPLVSERNGGNWTATVPPGAIADFLHNLTGLAVLLPIEATAQELQHFGLEPPQAEIELTRQNGPPIVVLLGDHNPSATGAYVRLGRDGHVVLAGALVLWEFDKAYKALAG